MTHEIRSESQNCDGRYAIVVSTYNSNITNKLLAGAVETLTTAGIPSANIVLVRVPGAWELPLAATWLAKNVSISAVITLGMMLGIGLSIMSTLVVLTPTPTAASGTLPMWPTITESTKFTRTCPSCESMTG